MNCLKWFWVALAFFLLSLIFVIVLMSKEAIADAAMANVSFASAVVSIVLAVLSIIISMIASARTQGNLDSMREVERKRLKDIRQDIRDFRAAIVPNRFGQQQEFKASGQCFMMYGTEKGNIGEPERKEKSETATDLPGSEKLRKYMMLSERALDKIETIFRCSIARNFRLRAVPSITFDGFATISGEPYVFEVKVVQSPNNALSAFRKYLENLNFALENLNLSVSVVIVAVCPDEKVKNATLDLLTHSRIFPGLNVSALCFTQAELENPEKSEL